MHTLPWASPRPTTQAHGTLIATQGTFGEVLVSPRALVVVVAVGRCILHSGPGLQEQLKYKQKEGGVYTHPRNVQYF